MNHLIISAALAVAGAPLYAAPFMVCNLDINSRIIVDFGDNTLAFDSSEWLYAQVIVDDAGIMAEYVSDGYVVGIAYIAAEDEAYYKIASPEGETYGTAKCSYQER